MMATKKNPEQPKVRPVKVQVAFDGTPDKDIAVEAYAFDRSGRYLASANLAKGTATLALTTEQAKRARLFFGPPLIEERPQITPTLELMARLNAYEAVWNFQEGRELHVLDPFPRVYWEWWAWCSCRVRGRVVRPVEVGGTAEQFPVCHARVHICEVDRWPYIIAKLPDRVIYRLRDELIREIERPIRWPRPLPDPPPFVFDPGVIDPSPENLAHMQQPASSRPVLDLEASAINPQPEPPGFEARPLATEPFSALDKAALGPQPEPPDTELTLKASPSLPLASEVAIASPLKLETRVQLTSGSLNTVRQALVEQVHLILPYLCYWPWFWPWFRCDEMKVVETDAQGRFDTSIKYLCFGDKPDLYFWVEACIGGTWETVYRPFLPCNTYWNYACGTEVTLTVTDPRVPICNEPPDLAGLQVAVMSIGNNVSVSETQLNGLTTANQPFGGVLEPHVWFSRGALIAAGVTHYRWSYQRQTDGDGNPVTDTWHALDRRVIRHYAMIEQTAPDYPLSFPAYPIGPDPAAATPNLFKIQPVNVDVPPPPNHVITGWAPLDAREDSASAFFSTHLLSGGNAAAATGRYRLKFELFDSTGARVIPANLGILLKEATDPAPFGTGTVHTSLAAPAHLYKEAGTTYGFKIDVWVDNNPCQAEIYSVVGPQLQVNTPCGFVRYEPGASALLRFKAYHPNDHATFRFETFRGPSIKVPEASAPNTPPDSGSANVGPVVVNGFTPNAARVYSRWVGVHTLLTSNKPVATPDCISAAFAEALYVWAKATDGWHRLSYLDARGLPKAFALAPKP